MNIVVIIVITLLAFGAAFFGAVAVTQRRSLRRYAAERTELLASREAERVSLQELSLEGERLRMRNEFLENKLQSDKQELEKLQETFRAEFRNMAGDILEEKSRLFKETNKESLEGLLKPFRLNITEFRERVEKIYSSENEQRGALHNEIKNLMELNRTITRETTELTNALKGNSKTQGDWGEVILETILESSALIKGIHYTTQESIRDGEGNLLRPDVVLNLPEGKQIVIDSKVSLTAFVEYVNAPDDGQHEGNGRRETALKAHLLSVRRHIDELGTKRYQSLVAGSPDFVIMFIPNEPAFLAAVGADGSLWSYAYNKKVIISSPTNLFALLKMVDDMWKRDNQSRNAIAIAHEAAGLLDKFGTFAETLVGVGKSIDTAKERYDKALGQLRDGRGNLVARSRKLQQMGVKATKQLPIELAEGDDEVEGADGAEGDEAQ